ncbi:MAG: DNA repair protein RecO [Rhodobacteraceae bacterium]|nr:DNA repair protein RecO [Paracoccaceae bacterium]
MEWRDEGVLLAQRRHGETAVIIDVLTAEHGRHAGLVHGGAGRKMRAALQPGTQLDLTWRARIEDQLGAYHAEPIRARTVAAMSSRLALAGLNAVCAMVLISLPERDPHAPLYERTIALFDLLGEDDVWPLAYLNWEMALLEEMGFGLDLNVCAVTGAQSGLVYISPKSGRAVSQAAAGEWASRLLPLVPVMRGQGDAEPADISAALATTGWFIEQRLLAGTRGLPPARGRLLEQIARLG